MGEAQHTVGLLFCGGCNPHIDRRRFAAALRQLLPPERYRLAINEHKAPFVVHVSGCGATCAVRSRPAGSAGVEIAGRSFERAEAAEAQLAGLAAAAVRQFFEQ